MVEQPATVDEYIASFPDEVQVVLEKVRQSIRNVAPQAGETGTGTLRFPLNEPIPYDLIKRVVTLLAQQRSADR
jgi:uncharacterized protein YdhG (YjbR/CyaY superfamily)